MVTTTYTKSAVKTANIHPEFTAGRRTNYEGLVPFGDFLLDKLAFQEALAEQLDLGRGGPIKKLEKSSNIPPFKEPVRPPAEGN